MSDTKQEVDILQRRFTYDGHGINIDGPRFATIARNFNGEGPMLVTGEGDNDYRTMTREEVDTIANLFANAPKTLKERDCLREALEMAIDRMEMNNCEGSEDEFIAEANAVLASLSS